LRWRPPPYRRLNRHPRSAAAVPTAIAMRGADAYGVVKTKTGACERRVIAPLTWAVEYGAASGDVRVGTATSNLAPPLRGAFLCALAHNANVAPLACLRNQPKLLHRLTDLVLVPARETRCWRRTANRRADVTCLPVEEHPRFEISKMQSRHRLVEQTGQRSQRHDHKCRSSNNVERCCSSRTLTCSVQSLNYCIEDTSSRTESNRRT